MKGIQVFSLDTFDPVLVAAVISPLLLLTMSHVFQQPFCKYMGRTCYSLFLSLYLNQSYSDTKSNIRNRKAVSV